MIRTIRILTLALLLIPGAGRGDSGVDYTGALSAAEAMTRAKEWTEAASLWTKVVAANPVNARFWEQLGLARYSAKDFRGAIPAYEKALALGGGFPFNQAYNIGCCYALLGEKEPAFEWLRKSMDLGWRDLIHARNDDDLIPLREDPRFKGLFAVVDVSKLTREQGYRFDIRLLTRELKRLHYNLRRGVRAAELESESSKLLEAVPSLSDAQVKLGMIKLARIANDGHTSLRAGHSATLPVQFYRFEEGVFITAASPERQDLVGAQLLKRYGGEGGRAYRAPRQPGQRHGNQGPGPFLPARARATERVGHQRNIRQSIAFDQRPDGQGAYVRSQSNQRAALRFVGLDD